MNEWPEIIVNLHDKTIKSIDYGWDNKDFVVIDKDTKKQYRFKDAYIQLNPDLDSSNENHIVFECPFRIEEKK